MSPIRRDGEGQLEAGPTGESLADRQIREAQERGEFEERDAILGRAANASPLMRGRYRAELSRVVQAYNRQVLVLSVVAPSYRQHRARIDEAMALEALERAWSGATPDS